MNSIEVFLVENMLAELSAEYDCNLELVRRKFDSDSSIIECRILMTKCVFLYRYCHSLDELRDELVDFIFNRCINTFVEDIMNKYRAMPEHAILRVRVQDYVRYGNWSQVMRGKV